MAPMKTFSPLVLAGFAAARQCSNFLIPVDIASRQGQFAEIPVEGNLDIGAFATRFNQFGKNYTATLLQGYQTLKGSYEISAQHCTPDSGSSDTVQVLSHGIGFDKTYWDLDYNNYNYSYVNNALAAGYSTLAIDRLGVGNSSHGDPFNEIQAQAEVEALNAVTTKLRNGEIPQIGHSYEKVVHVGHSFGSVQSYWLSALYPNNTDGVILTGYSVASQFLSYVIAGWNLHSARLNQPLRLGNASNEEVMQLATSTGLGMNLVPGLQKLLASAGIDLTTQEIWNQVATTEVLDLITGYNKSGMPLDYPSGYMVSADLTNLQYAFLFPGMYDIGIALAGEQTKQPVTVGELLTIGSAPAMSPFTGPVLVVTGEHDVPFCGGNCYAPLPNATAADIPAGVVAAFPNASAFKSHIQPGTGHGLTFHYNATAGYQVIQDFLASNDLAA
ncbi:alpha/beta-hydrolase [Dothidotthia symphoricarpi CBS 119687]|uniref:Alpha/beta-hydrolase n=1 Tax=Dothidotthia symphoricarpi CBS 119687 TaxID=1392245 RepID=A0A6A6AN44_9PLEO|nr:alpha/beta-hydrolase [Dothidotthia symphoricarpi CBS 119687]KAF2132307.1 alpha/beta-hydrolase [Dothidotthia symphoricarpi CBS 119687]